MEEDAMTEVDGNSPVRRTRGDATAVLWRELQICSKDMMPRDLLQGDAAAARSAFGGRESPFNSESV
ncbi:uncharacterized protein G2W53_007509 [Senna tora]|uniref:Uncharacterized protein n=1 Tax=Senna tora TaxID=362788 RepID=A0A835CHC2_9FABA|nr:uncharacterized protein G2W53_007509 [Senna tora]